jgi:hypothetical protein
MPSWSAFSAKHAKIGAQEAVVEVRMLMAGSLLVALAACGAKLSPLQERAWDAFKDCQQQVPRTECGSSN